MTDNNEIIRESVNEAIELEHAISKVIQNSGIHEAMAALSICTAKAFIKNGTSRAEFRQSMLVSFDAATVLCRMPK